MSFSHLYCYDQDDDEKFHVFSDGNRIVATYGLDTEISQITGIKIEDGTVLVEGYVEEDPWSPFDSSPTTDIDPHFRSEICKTTSVHKIIFEKLNKNGINNSENSENENYLTDNLELNYIAKIFSLCGVKCDISWDKISY